MFMVFYDIMNREHRFDNLEKIGEGCCGTVYKYDPEWVIKHYNKTCSDDYRLSKFIYDLIRQINSSHIAEVKDLLFEQKIEDIIFDVNFFFKHRPIDAYTCRYIKEDRFDMLTTPTDYVLDNMNEISKIFNIFSENGIRTNDVKAANAIVQTDKVVLIDLDGFEKVNVSCLGLNAFNQRQILHLFRGLLLNSICEYDYDSRLTLGLYDLFDFSSISIDADVVSELQNRISGYKYPIDAIKKYKKK